jgi:hypothetical protein
MSIKKQEFWSRNFAINDYVEMFQKKMHDHIDESLNDVHFSYLYKDYQFYENVWSSN